MKPFDTVCHADLARVAGGQAATPTANVCGIDVPAKNVQMVGSLYHPALLVQNFAADGRNTTICSVGNMPAVVAHPRGTEPGYARIIRN